MRLLRWGFVYRLISSFVATSLVKFQVSRQARSTQLNSTVIQNSCVAYGQADQTFQGLYNAVLLLGKKVFRNHTDSGLRLVINIEIYSPSLIAQVEFFLARVLLFLL
ncbi:hypothetical protein K1719_025440 [Acacia pycnantha]|nr:hypothetical protein K1719_025440 [Acacia pycnantha]